MLSRISLPAKLILLMAMSGLALAASLGVGVVLTRQRAIEERIATLRAAVSLSMGLAQSLELEVTAGALSREAALNELREYLHSARFGGPDDYLVVLRPNGEVVINGRDHEREGKLANITNGEGRSSVELATQVLSKAPAGIMTIQVAKSGLRRPRNKMAYVAWFAPWRLIFIAGAWVDDIEKSYDRILYRLCEIGGLILCVSLLGAWFVSADISTSLGALRIAMERLAKGDLAVEAPGTDRRDEIGGMAKAVMIFQAHMINARHLAAERELSEQRLQDYIATASDWHWESDADFRFTNISRQAGAHGIDPDSLIGLDRLNEYDAAGAIAAHRAMLSLREPFKDLRHDYPTERGLRTIALSGLPVIGENGTFLGYRGSARDITAQMRAEAMQHMALWSAEQATRAKSNFLATMSHEIRTPMNGVLGMVQLLSQTALDGEQRQMCDTIFRSGKSLLQILNDVLDYSKLEAHKIELELVGCQLTDIVYDVAALMRGTAEAKGLTIAVEVAGDKSTPASVDPTRLRQVLINLMSNAIKFSERGTITMGLNVKIGDPGRLAVALTVSDQGIGIQPEARRHLFQRFSQADTSITRRFGGTGLGLAITRELVGLMGGEIDVASTPGESTTFTVTLGLSIAAAVASMTETLSPDTVQVSGRRLDILVAEDDEINQAVLRGMLAGHRITFADDGAAAVRLADGRYDVILMDIMMPVMDGVAATAAIRALGTSASAVPIIALTANAVSGDRERYLAAGMNGYVSKPIEQTLLLRELEQVLGVTLARPVVAKARPSLPPEPDDILELDDFIASIGV